MILIKVSGSFVDAIVTRDMILDLWISCLSPKDVLSGDDGTVEYY